MRHALAWPIMAWCVAAPAAAEEAQGGARPLDGVDIVEQIGGQVPPGLVFHDQTGNPVRLGERFGRGRPLVLVLGWYRCPMLCSLVLAGAARALPWGGAWRLGGDVDALTVSFASDENQHDAALRRRAHLATLGAPPESGEWPFLTGDDAAIGALTAAVGFRYSRDPATGQYAHAAVLIVLTPDGRVSRYLYGVQYAERDLRLALVEAAGGRAGPSIDRVLLACYRYDPARRKYGLFLERFLQVGGLLVFAAVASVLAVLWRREVAHDTRGIAWPPKVDS